MKVYFLRHGEASYDAPTDEQRPLTPDGTERIRAAARALYRLEVHLDAIYSSPRVRAHQTAQIVADTYRQPVVIRDALDFQFNVELCQRLLAEHPLEAGVLLVGHNPSMSEVVHAISGGHITLKTGALARIDLTPPIYTSGVLKWLLSPRVLDALGG